MSIRQPPRQASNESGARGVFLVEVDNGRNVHLDFRAMDCVRWERFTLDISPLQTEQDLIEAFDQLISTARDDAGGRSVVLRIALTGRSSLHGALRQPGFREDLIANLNDEWTKRSPFAWCERVDDETAAPFKTGRNASKDQIFWRKSSRLRNERKLILTCKIVCAKASRSYTNTVNIAATCLT